MGRECPCPFNSWIILSFIREKDVTMKTVNYALKFCSMITTESSNWNIGKDINLKCTSILLIAIILFVLFIFESLTLTLIFGTSNFSILKECDYIMTTVKLWSIKGKKYSFGQKESMSIRNSSSQLVVYFFSCN